MNPDDELPLPEHDPAEVREAADRILGGDDFRDDRNLLERFAEWLVDRIGDLFDGLGGAGSGLGVFGLVVQLLILALALTVLAFAIRALVRAQRSRLRLDDDAEVTVVLGVPGDPDALRREVEAAETSGAWKVALLARYRLVVATFVAAGVLADVAGRTTGEYRRELAEVRPDHSSTFGAATRAFEAAYYGDVEVGPGDVDDMRARAATLLGERETVGADR